VVGAVGGGSGSGLVSGYRTTATGSRRRPKEEAGVRATERVTGPNRPGQTVGVELRLVPFDPALASAILGWVRSPAEREAWASLAEAPGPEVFERWHADPDVAAYVLKQSGDPVAYGEVWRDEAEDEAELARIVVDPAARGRGVGRRFVGLLVARARASGLSEVVLRVHPGNAAALACYAGAGFERYGPEEQAAFNRAQPRAYVWMRLAPSAG
jgi:ribosomal protein S18 acetylase RimI-like enzyme